MSRDLNWTIMISLFFRSFLQTRILRFSGETASAKRVRGARHTRQGSRLYQSRLSTATSCCAMLMSPNKGETAVHGCHCPGDMAVRMSKVLTRPWVGVRVPLALSLSHYFVLP